MLVSRMTMPTPRLSATPREVRQPGSWGIEFSQLPTNTPTRPSLSAASRSGGPVRALAEQKPAARPSSARPSAGARPASLPSAGIKKRNSHSSSNSASTGAAELERRRNLPDGHPDKITVPTAPPGEVQWALSAVDAPPLPSLTSRYVDVAITGGAWSRDLRCAACHFCPQSKTHTVYVLDSTTTCDKNMNVFHLEDNRWELFSSKGQVPSSLEHGSTMTVVGDILYVLGGRPAPGRPSRVAARATAGGFVFSFDTTTGIWKQQFVDAAWPRKGHTATLVGDTNIYVYAGDLALPDAEIHDQDGARLQPDLVVFDTVKMAVRTPTVLGDVPARRALHSACYVPPNVVTFSQLPAAAAPHAAKDGKKKACNAARRHETDATKAAADKQSKGSLWIFGGKIGPVCVNDLMTLDLDTYAWTCPVTTGMPCFGMLACA